jgi:hypothetical protein
MEGAKSKFPFDTLFTSLLGGGRVLPSKWRKMTLLVYANLEKIMCWSGETQAESSKIYQMK